MKRKRMFSPETVTFLVMRTITLALAAFLILLADNFIADLEDWLPKPEPQATAGAADTREIEARISKQRAVLERKRDEIESAQAAFDVAARDYTSAKETYDNWLRARTAVNSPDQDQEIVTRAHALDQKMAVRTSWADKVAALTAEKVEIAKGLSTLEGTREQRERVAYALRQAEQHRYEVKAFLWRMGVVLPVLALGVWMFVRWRNAKYGALAWGYILFSGYTFFVGVVPFVPSFGGYLRYAVGIILTVAGGIYAIRGMQAYAERKRKELRQSSAERARKISDEAAITAFREHRCPSCDHDYALPKASASEPAPSFCYHCGLRLYGACAACGTVNFVHFNHCKSCGVALKEAVG